MLDKQARADVSKAYELIKKTIEIELEALDGYEERAQLIAHLEDLLGACKDENEAAFVEECKSPLIMDGIDEREHSFTD